MKFTSLDARSTFHTVDDWLTWVEALDEGDQVLCQEFLPGRGSRGLPERWLFWTARMNGKESLSYNYKRQL